ncbi:MAG: hypothetical protein JNL38_34790 [Myxococcales bacterium]|nr:hypothetical protein [Myxococcales bacterium]
MIQASLSASPSTSTAPASANLGSILKGAALGGLASAVGNYVVYGASIAAGVDFLGRYQGPDSPVSGVPVPMIGVSSFVPALVGGLLYAGLAKLTSRSRGVFAAVATILTVLSFGGPASIAGASPGTKIALSVMHVVAAVFIVGGIFRGARASRS